jgi:uncharacterized protein YggE
VKKEGSLNKTALIALIALSIAPLYAQTSAVPELRPTAPDTISVTGTGKVTGVADQVMFTAGVETAAPTVEDAANQNNATTAKLIAALKKAGATDKEIRTSNFQVFPQYENVDNRRPRVIGFQVTNSVTVSRRNPTEAGKLLTVALQNGANQVSGLSFTISDQTALRNRGLQLAFEDARAKAQLLATSAGRSIGRAVTISEGTQPMFQPPQPMYGKVAAMEARVSDVPVEQGSEELSFSVSVMFEMK